MREITPALTAAEWAERWMDTSEAGDVGGEFCIHCEMSEPVKNRHGLAALALHGQPFGFTAADVEAIDEGISAIGINHSDRCSFNACPCEAEEAALRSLRDRIAALLPPEASNGSE